MVDLNRLEKATVQTQVDPSDNIFHELGNNTYDFTDLLSELIDNSIAAKVEGTKLNVSIKMIVDGSGVGKRIIVQDNASGIDQEDLGEAISPAGKQSNDSLNEHGLGMKQAVSALGTLEYLATRTAGEEHARVVLRFAFGSLDTYKTHFGLSSGTEISIINLKTVAKQKINPHSITMTVAPYLGARYREYLKEDHKLADIILEIVDEDSGVTKNHWNLVEFKPIYFHPGSRTNQPVIQNYLIEGDDWKAELVFGYAPNTDAEYEELGIEPVNKYHPYYVSLNRQGLDILLHDRVILFHQLSEIGIISSPHNEYNTVRGEISLIHGFRTAITKNNMIEDANLVECIERVQGILKGELAGPGGQKETVPEAPYIP